MRKLLNTLFVLSDNVYLSLDGENIVIESEGKEMNRFPLHLFEGVICCSYKGASPALMGKLGDSGKSISFLTPHGKFLARSTGRRYGNVLLRKEQFRISENEEESLAYAQSFMLGKLYNSRWTLERTIRDNALRVDCNSLKSASSALKQAMEKVSTSSSMPELLGIEGSSAKIYFEVFNEMILNNKEDFRFSERSRRPPKDRINALLSFTYSLLASDCTNALEAVGLDPYVGFYHRDRPGRKSLALDLMEEYRSCIADRFVLGIVNRKIITKEDFRITTDTSVLLSDEGRKRLLQFWQARKQETIVHPFLKERVEWGIVPYIQALLLARSIRGDLNRYPPFFWK